MTSTSEREPQPEKISKIKQESSPDEMPQVKQEEDEYGPIKIEDVPPLTPLSYEEQALDSQPETYCGPYDPNDFRFNAYGYDKEGYNADGYDKHGFNKDGLHFMSFMEGFYWEEEKMGNDEDAGFEDDMGYGEEGDSEQLLDHESGDEFTNSEGDYDYSRWEQA